MRAALLPTPGDPFMLAYWLRNYETWAAAVDDLVVLVNGQTDPEVLAYDRAIVEAVGGRFFSTPDRIGHDGAILRLLQLTGARHVVLCEDDAYVRKPAEVARAFARIEDGELDIVGSPRHEDYASSPLQVWPDDLTKDPIEVRRGFWPAFLFIARDDLLSTDRIFGDRRWNIGNTIAGLDMPVTRELCEYVGISPNYIHLDTLFGTSFQLRARHPKVELVHHVRLFDAAAAEEWIDEDPPWFHVTGLSTLDMVLDPPDFIPDMDEHGGLWTRRMAWWWQVTFGYEEIPGYRERDAALRAFVRSTGMRDRDLRAWAARFDPWAAWDERVLVPA